MSDISHNSSQISPGIPTMLRSGQLCLLLVLFLIPIIFAPSAIDYQNSIVTILKDVSFLLLAPLTLFFAIGALIQDSRRRILQNAFPLLLPLFLLGLWIFIRLLQAPYPSAAFREAHRWFAYLCIGAAAGLLAGDNRFRQAVWSWILATSGLLSIYGIIQFFGIDVFDWGLFEWALPIRRVCSSFGNPNFLGGYLVLTLPFTLAALASRRIWEGKGILLLCFIIHAGIIALCILQGGAFSIVRLYDYFTSPGTLPEDLGKNVTPGIRLLLTCIQVLVLLIPLAGYYILKRWRQASLYPLFFILCFQLAALALTMSQGSLMAVILSCFIVSVLWIISRIRNKGNDQTTRRAMALLIGLIVIALLFIYPASRFMLHFRERTVLERLEMYKGTIHMIKERPLTGFGPGMYSVYFPDYRPTQLALYLSPGENLIDHAHCEYLELASELGIIGLGLFLWIFLAAVGPAVIRLLREPPSRIRWFRAALFAALIGTFFQNFLSVNLRQISTASAFWIYLGLLGGMGKYSDRPISPLYARLKTGLTWIMAIALMAGIYFNILQVGKMYQADLLFTRGMKAQGEMDYRRSLYLYKKAIQINPYQTKIYYIMAALQYLYEDYEGALESYRKVYELEKDYVDVIFNMATVYSKMGKLKEGLQLFEQALPKDPTSARLHDYYARMLIVDGREEEAAEYRKKAIELYRVKLGYYPRDARLNYDLGKNYHIDGQWEEAEYWYKKAVEFEPENPFYHEHLQSFYAQRAQFKKAKN